MKFPSGPLGPGNLDVAAALAALTGLLDGQGQYDEAEALYQRAIAVFERTLGPEHYEIAANAVMWR